MESSCGRHGGSVAGGEGIEGQTAAKFRGHNGHEAKREAGGGEGGEREQRVARRKGGCPPSRGGHGGNGSVEMGCKTVSG